MKTPQLLLLLLLALQTLTASSSSSSFLSPRQRSSSSAFILPAAPHPHHPSSSPFRSSTPPTPTTTLTRTLLPFPKRQRSPSPFSSSSSLLPLHALPPTLLQDLGGATLVGLASALWLKVWTTLAKAGQIDSKDSRKIIHCGSGPLFMLCWPFFSADPTARFYAAAVPALQALAVIGAGMTKQTDASTPPSSSSLPITDTQTLDLTTQPQPQTKPSKKKRVANGLVAAISRSGNPAEVLRGPLIYVFILLLSTVLYWRTSVIGLVAVSQMAAGDGMADIIGRRWGTLKWPFSERKSYIGTAAFAICGFVVSIGLMAWFNLWGLVPALTQEKVVRVGVISVLCALVELVPLGDDNVSVPVAASVFAMLLLQ